MLIATTTPPERVAAQSADNGLEEASVNSFEFDPTRGVVRVTIDIDLRNVTTDRVEGDLIRRTFFDSYYAAVPRGAENIVATRNGSVLEGTLESDPEFPAFSIYRFPLGTELFSGQSTSVQVTYDHLGAPPRDPVPWRVNEAYAGFVAFGLGDEGLVTLRISQPFGYEFDEFTDLTGFAVSEPDQFATVVHTRAGLDEDTRITVGLANDDRLVSTPLDVEGVDIGLRSWPDDPEWAAFASAKVEAGIPALEELIGTPWPVEGSFAVRQTVEPSRSGYAGWFDAKSNEIAVGEALDADTIYHELSHAWINRRLTTERWFTEGLPQVYAAELVRRDGDEARTPSEPALDDPAARPLTTWTADDEERAVEEYGYATSFWVLDGLVDEIGFDRTREVVAALASGSSPYGATSAVERPDLDWKRVYDVLVEVGGATTAGDVFRSHVVGEEDAPTIERRDRAAADVADLTERSAPWALPVGVRNRLERWEIDDVTEAVIAADAVLERRTELEAIEQSVGVDEPDGADVEYASAPMQPTGGVDFTEVTATLDEAIALGEQLTGQLQQIAVVAPQAGVSPPELSDIEGVADFASGIAATEVQLDAMARIIELDDELDAASGIFVTIGRWGSDIEGELDAARSQVERGDSDAALAILDSAEVRIDDLAAAGRVRVLLTGALVIVVIVVIVVFILVARSRRAVRRQDSAELTQR
ncbi:MAG: hypothetical protein ACM3MM_03570 [Acidobacteriota bacterium]